MREEIRVLLLGTGQMGSMIARVLMGKEGLQLAAAYDMWTERVDLDLGNAFGLDQNPNIPISNDLASIIEHTKPHVAIQATCSTLDDARDEINTLLTHGVNVITIAEEMAYPAAKSPAYAEDLNRIAINHGVSLLGTGINPGFVLDLLVVTLTGICSEIQSITAKRVNDLSPFGPSVLKSQGVGLVPAEFDEGLHEGTVVGHIGFDQSIHMIADSLGWEISRIERSCDPIVSQVKRATPFVTVEPGQVAGCFHTATAYRQDQPVITLIHPQQIHPQLEGIETGDMIEITGSPNVRLEGSPEIAGGQGTAAIAVNMIPRVLNAAPGLYSMTEFPVPAAMLGDARKFVKDL